MDFKNLLKFSFKNESVWMLFFGLLPLVIGIAIMLVIMILQELT